MSIKIWWQKRKEKCEMEELKAGFGWAMAEYHIEGVSVEDLQRYAENPFHFTSFDRGILQAVREIELPH